MTLSSLGKELMRYVRLYLLRDEFTIEHNRWVHDNGDETLRLNYPNLNSSSIVFDVGGYLGDFAFLINEKYDCTVFLFEPDPKFYEHCVQRFDSNEKIFPLNHGLADQNSFLTLSQEADGSSFYNIGHNIKGGLRCQVRDVVEVLAELSVSNIDLMKINIEGGEFPLIERLIEENLLVIVDQIQIQFHNFVENASEIREEFLAQVAKTHDPTWCYKFVWENWKRKS